MLNLVRTQNHIASLKCCVAEEHGSSALYGIDTRHRRPVRNEGIVVAIDDENGVRCDYWRHGFRLKIAGTDCNESFPTSSVGRAPGAQMIKISRREFDQFQNGTHSYLRLIHSYGLRYERNVICRYRIFIAGCMDIAIWHLRHQFFDRDGLSRQDAIKRVLAETALAAKKIGDVRRLEPGLTGQQRATEHSALDAAQKFQAKLLM